jgi:hypothetical protein
VLAHTEHLLHLVTIKAVAVAVVIVVRLLVQILSGAVAVAVVLLVRQVVEAQVLMVATEVVVGHVVMECQVRNQQVAVEELLLEVYQVLAVLVELS